MINRSRIPAVLAAALALAVAAPALSQSAAPTERVTLKGRKGPKLLRPGYEVGEYTGSYSARAMARKGLGSLDRVRADFDLTSPDLAQPIVADCAGGQSRFKLVITWDRDDLSYNCNYGGAAPADARLEVAVARGKSILSRLQGNQRAGELHWKDQVIRFETAQMKGLPLSAGKPAAYVFTKDGVEVGRVDIVSGMGLSPPTFYLPPKGAPEREAVAVAALSLYFFPDPGDK